MGRAERGTWRCKLWIRQVMPKATSRTLVRVKALMALVSFWILRYRGLADLVATPSLMRTVSLATAAASTSPVLSLAPHPSTVPLLPQPWFLTVWLPHRLHKHYQGTS